MRRRKNSRVCSRARHLTPYSFQKQSQLSKRWKECAQGGAASPMNPLWEDTAGPSASTISPHLGLPHESCTCWPHKGKFMPFLLAAFGVSVQFRAFLPLRNPPTHLHMDGPLLHPCPSSLFLALHPLSHLQVKQHLFLIRSNNYRGGMES